MAAMRGASSPSSEINGNTASIINQVQSSSFPTHLNFNLPLKLDRNNFILWKSQVLPAIRAYDLEEFILGLKKSPKKYLEASSDDFREDSRTVNPDFIQWKKADQLLVCWLLSTLTPSILTQVTHCVTSCEVWSTLEKLYSQQSLAKIMQIRSQLQSTKKGLSSISEYISKMKTLADALGAAGQPISDRDLVMHVLEGLSCEYDAVVVSLTTQLNSTGEVSLQDAQFLLMSYETRLEQQAMVSASIASSNATANYSYSDKPGQRGGMQNYNRGRRGRGKGRNGGRYNTRTICQLCGRSGHYSAICFHRFDPNFQGNRMVFQGGSNSVSGQGSLQGNHVNFQGNLQQANALYTPLHSQHHSQGSETSWCLDSGATNHCTAELGNLNIKSEYKGPEKLTVGNGSEFEENSSTRGAERWIVPS